MSKIKVIQIGLGPIGMMVNRYLQERTEFEITGLFDVNPELVGTKMGGVEIKKELELEGVHVAIVTTTSSFLKIIPLLKTLIAAKVHVVSSCEELFYPLRTFPDESLQIFTMAQDHGVRVIGTGVNPGMLMDKLASFYSDLVGPIKGFQIERLQDATSRRGPFKEKIGYGLSIEEFNNKRDKGTLRHVGLKESMDFLCDNFGLHYESYHEDLGPYLQGEEIVGVDQQAFVLKGGKEFARLIFKAAVGLEKPVDRITLYTDEGEHKLEIPGATQGDQATAHMLINTAKNLFLV